MEKSAHTRNWLSRFKRSYKEVIRWMDWPLFFVSFLLIVLGLIMIFSATSTQTLTGGLNNPFSFLLTQGVALLLGLMLALILLLIPYYFLKDFRSLLTAMAFVTLLLVATLLLADTVNGARSWLSIAGFSLQISEFIKPLGIMVMAWFLVNNEREVKLALNGQVPRQMYTLLGLLILDLGLIFLQPDLGMVFIILAVIIMMTMAQRSLKLNLGIFACVGLLYALMYNYFSGYQTASQSYQINRFLAMVDPFKFRQGIGYQIINGYHAFSNGGWFGVGLGRSQMKQGYIPAVHNDFILALVGEELGFLGVLLVLALYFYLIYRLLRWASQAKDSYRSKVLLGIGLLFFIQMTVNIGGITGILPLTGVTLPFLSYGGTSAMVFLTTLGLAQRIIIQERKDHHHHLNLVYSKAKGGHHGI